MGRERVKDVGWLSRINKTQIKKDEDDGAANNWGKASSSVGGRKRSRNKMESAEKGGDGWNRVSNKTGQTWSTKGANGGGWDCAVRTAHKAVSDAGGWSKAAPEALTFGEDGWNRAVWKPHTASNTHPSGWEQTKLASSDAGESWNTEGVSAGWDFSAKPSVGDGSESKRWNNVKRLPSSSGWDNSKATATDTNGGWKTTMNGNQAAGWGASAIPFINEDHTCSWSKGVGSSRQTHNWCKVARNNDNWNTCKTFENKRTGWNQTSNDASTDWGGKNSPNWDSKKEPASSPGNWGGKDSSGNQSANSNNGAVDKWGHQSGHQDKFESRKRGSDFGRGGRRGRDNSFSRGRGFGRNSGRRHSHGWNSNDDSNRESNYANQHSKAGGSRSRGNGTFEAQKRSWNSARKSQGKNQAKQGSGWLSSAFSSIDKIERSASSIERSARSIERSAHSIARLATIGIQMLHKVDHARVHR